MMSVVFGAAIALVGALAWMAIDWERIRARVVRFGVQHDIAIFQDGVPFGMFLFAAIGWFVGSCFVGSWAIVAWIWGLA